MSRARRTRQGPAAETPDFAVEMASLREDNRQLRELVTQWIQNQQAREAPLPQAEPAPVAPPEPQPEPQVAPPEPQHVPPAPPVEAVAPPGPIGGQARNQIVAQPEPLYGRFRQMSPPEFEGSTDPLEAEEWMSTIQTIFEFIKLTDREKILCASFAMKKDARY